MFYSVILDRRDGTSFGCSAFPKSPTEVAAMNAREGWPRFVIAPCRSRTHSHALGRAVRLRGRLILATLRRRTS